MKYNGILIGTLCALLQVLFRMTFISISTQTQNIKLCNVGKYNQSKDEKADKQH